MAEANKVYKGGCICGSVSYEVTGKPIRSVYCHCTLCQRLNGMSPRRSWLDLAQIPRVDLACAFIHTIHFPASAFTWTHEEPYGDVIETYSVESKPWKTRSRCKKCGCCVSSYNARANRRSIWSGQLERDELEKIKYWADLRPTAHIFYGTRMLDIQDDLAKWEGYNDESRRLG